MFLGVSSCTLPADATLRATLRVADVEHCEEVLSVPGEGQTAAWLDACAAVVATLPPCFAGGQPDACAAPAGTLDTGQPCSDDTQCQASDYCSGTAGSCGTC